MKNSSAQVPHHSAGGLLSFVRSPLLLILCGLGFYSAVCQLETPVTAQEPADKSTATASIVRPCSAIQARKNKTKAKGAAKVEKFDLGCLEAQGSPVDFQEFFQSYVREQRWRIGDEKIAEDSWIFSRLLERNELLQFAKEGALAGRVKWTEGKALLQITAHELDGGFTRVEISARFQGNGQSVDRFAPPKDTWDLDSSGALEKILIAALEAHLKSLH